MRLRSYIMAVGAFLTSAFWSNACDGFSVNTISSSYVGGGIYEVTIEYCETVSNSNGLGTYASVFGVLVQINGANIIGTSTPTMTGQTTGVTYNFNQLSSNQAEWGDWDNPSNTPILNYGDPQECWTFVLQVDGAPTSVTFAGSSYPGCTGYGMTNLYGYCCCNETVSFPPPVCDASWTPPSICPGSTTPIDLNTTTAGTGVWSGPGVNSATGILDPTGLTPPISVTFTVGDAGFNCSSTQNIDVVNITNPNMADQTICPGASVNLDATSTGGAPPTCTYQLYLVDSYGDGWNGADIDIYVNGVLWQGNVTVANCGSSPCTNTLNIPVSDGDQITLYYTPGSWNSENTVTMYDAGGGQVASINNPPSGWLGGGITVNCPGAALTYSWSPGTGLSATNIPNPMATPASTTTYTVTITDPTSGCSITDDVEITVGSGTTPVIDPAGPFCMSDPAFAMTVTGAAGSWSASCGACIDASGNFDPAVAGSGTHTITYTESGACGGVGNLNVVVDPDDDPSFILTDFCITAANSASGIATPGGMFSFNPDPLDGSSVDPVTGEVSNPVGGATYSIQYATSGACPASLTQMVNVGALEDPTFSYSPSTFCSSDADPAASITGTAGGTFTSTGGLVFLNTTTGLVDLSASTAGTYTITYTTPDPTCGSSSTFDITIDPVPTVDPIADQVHCAGDNSNQVVFSGNLAGTTYDWTNTNSAIGLATSGSGDISSFVTTNPGASQISGTITVTPSLNGCTGPTESFTIYVDPTPDASFSYDAGTYCTSGSDPVINFTGTPGGSFSASPAGLSLNTTTGAVTLSGSALNTYDITYTTSGSCPVSSVIQLTITAAPVADFTIPTPHCEGDAVMQAPTFINGGSAGTFNSSAGLVIDPATGVVDVAASSPGTYDITNTINLAGCAPANFTFNSFTINPLPTVDAGPDQTVCAGTPVTLSGSGAVGFVWSAGLGTSVTDGVAFTPAATDTYTVTGTDANGCQNTDDVVVTISNSIVVDAGPDQTVCEGTMVTLNGSGAGVGGSYAWSSSVTDGVPFNPGVAGTYTYDLTGTSASGCSGTDQVQVIVDPIPVVNPVSDITICEGVNVPDVQFTGSDPGITYDWTNSNPAIGLAANGTGDISTFSPAATGTATISVTPSLNGCVGTAETFDITVSPLEDPGFTYDAATYCVTGTAPVVNITGTPGGAFSSTAGLALDPATGAVDLATSTNGSYDVTYTTPGTCSQSAVVNITITDAPVADFTVTGPYCEGTAVIENPIFINGGSAGAFSATPAGLNLNPASGAIDVAASAPGVYDITNDINLAGCAPASHTHVGFTINALPTVAAGPDQIICNGDQVILSGSGAQSYAWSAALGTAVTDNSPFNPSLTDTYTVTGTDANGCVNTDQVVVTVNPIPTVNAGPDLTICAGETVTLSGSGTGTLAWNNNVTAGVPFTPPGASQSYTLTATDAIGCTNHDVVWVNVMPSALPNFDADVYSGCTPLQVHFSNLSFPGSQADTWLWDFGNGGISTAENPTLTFSEPGCYDVSLTITTDAGCVSSLVMPDFICVAEQPEALFNHSPNELTMSDPTVFFDNLSTGADSYTWSFGDSTGTNEVDPIHTFPAGIPGIYHVTLIASNAMGCSDTAISGVAVLDEILLYVPNVFTPDNDGFNETFKPVLTSGFDPYTYTLLIFNRWGEILFESQNSEIGWDGTYLGEVVKDGVYVWKISFRDNVTDKKQVYRGHVTLLK